MKISNQFAMLTKREWILWVSSIIIITVTFFIKSSGNYLTLVASLIGATFLIFIAKGMVIGQLLMLLFSVLYALISWNLCYYGEMLTYLGMTAPMAVLSAIQWIKNPYEGKKGVVKTAKLSKKKIFYLIIMAGIVTWIFYYILLYFNTANMMFSTISVTTSFLAAFLTFLRSPLYALGYAANDIVLIVLWVLATMGDKDYLPMIICFIIFLINDIYGYVSWRKMEKDQEKGFS
ncbi:nicotinamide riboside transporter PnuC [Clostridium bornimense]|uniref:nicotinamide riboside transporter PnuC n=1 Tax=Clostridium bornimense TaxID=1216932 RepID=UPI001C0F8EA2|nr:nicotinamide riboside transporter PnuC [Clostridium bornimense]MBU5315886.1 nicotinamide riboside transporter PnuC [Clostridium bornimense]